MDGETVKLVWWTVHEADFDAFRYQLLD